MRGRIIAAAVLVGLCCSGEAVAQDALPESQWRAVSRDLAAPWPKVQRPTGNLPDYLDGLVGNGEEGTRYGDSLTGYGLLQTGLREHDDTDVAAGIKAIDYATSGERTWPTPSVFETMAVAGAYNLAREQLATDPRFLASRPQWESWLRRVKTVRLHYVNRYGNHWLVDAISVLELERSGITSNRGGTVLGTGRTTAVREAVRLINTRVPKMVPGSGPFVLSDPPDNPLAYQALSLGLYARAIDLLGNRAGPLARQTLRRVVRASWAIAAPDGDLAYFGRSQGEIWALPATAYGAEVAAAQPGSGDVDDALDHALAARAIERLGDAYPIGPSGPWITPALADDLQAGARGLDAYAGAPSMGGLALVTLNWAIDTAPAGAAAGELPADHLFAVEGLPGPRPVRRRPPRRDLVRGQDDRHHRRPPPGRPALRLRPRRGQAPGRRQVGRPRSRAAADPRRRASPAPGRSSSAASPPTRTARRSASTRRAPCASPAASARRRTRSSATARSCTARRPAASSSSSAARPATSSRWRPSSWAASCPRSAAGT